MKRLILIIPILLLLTGISNAQNQVIDRHPETTIYIVDPQSGASVPARTDAAILFKDAYVDLASNATSAKLSQLKVVPGRKSTIITQLNPANGNVYQLTVQKRFLGTDVIIYTFQYNADQNALYFYDESSQTWLNEVVQGNNVVNMNNCLAYGRFNDLTPSQPDNNNANYSNAANNDTQAQAGDDDVYANNPPPELKEYDQPECPSDDYLWQPGYWAYNNADGYYWVSGEWVAPPTVGYLWTPPYWGFYDGRYAFHRGYWGSEIGFYGGINYGYGYAGEGFIGGIWVGGHFRYNTAVVRVNTRIRNVYVDRTVIRNVKTGSRVSFNGKGGIDRKPSPRELDADKHIAKVRDNKQDQKAANNNNNNARSQNNKNGNGNNGQHNANNANGAANGAPNQNGGNNGNEANGRRNAHNAAGGNNGQVNPNAGNNNGGQRTGYNPNNPNGSNQRNQNGAANNGTGQRNGAGGGYNPNNPNGGAQKAQGGNGGNQGNSSNNKNNAGSAKTPKVQKSPPPNKTDKSDDKKKP